MKTILITGGNGFLGSWLVRKLVETYKIIVIVRKIENIERIQGVLERIIIIDNSDQSIFGVFKDHQIDYIIHAATYYGRGNENILEYIETNVILPLKLLEVGIKNNIKAFINTDSFFNSSKQNYKFLSGYITSKKHINEWLSILCGQRLVINMKLQHIYGPHDKDDKFVIQMLHALISNQPQIELTPGKQKRDFIYIDDVVNAYICVLANIDVFQNTFNEVNVGNGKSISIMTFMETAKALTGSSSELLFSVLPYRENEIMDSTADTTILEELGWQPKYNLESGIVSTIKYLK
jgi:nucleoside-diphosphate-sugar epimerase